MFKISELSSLSKDDLSTKLESLKKDLFILSMKNKLRRLDDTSQLKKLKHQIQQIHMLLAN
jgi:ribosomal protein L29